MLQINLTDNFQGYHVVPEVIHPSLSPQEVTEISRERGHQTKIIF